MPGRNGLFRFLGIVACLLYDARLELEGIPEHVQSRLGVGCDETVTFVRLETDLYRDGLRFENGAEIPLYALPPGISATVTEALTSVVLPTRVAEVVA